MESKASASWSGTLKAGKGAMKPAHAAETVFSLGSRFEGASQSNPEEFIGAALAGCYSMALCLALEQAGATPKEVRTRADVKLEKQGDGFAITAIALDCQASASGIDDTRFQSVAQATKKGCPVSKALAGTSIALRATLTGG